MAFSTAASVGPVRQGLDEGRLAAYIELALPALAPELRGARPGPSLAVSQFSHGQSNPTYLLTLASGRRLVLRKKPPGKLLASAHAVEREYAVLAALAALPTPRVPVPRPLALCSDLAPVGTPFYLMEFADGTIFLDPNLPELTASQRSGVYRQMASTLAALHCIDAAVLPALAGFGNPERYCERQVSRWSAQYEASMPRPAPEVLELVAWLRRNVPAEDARPPRAAICHGDYRLDNIVFRGGCSSSANTNSEASASSPAGDLRAVAVLDWEVRGDVTHGQLTPQTSTMHYALCACHMCDRRGPEARPTPPPMPMRCSWPTMRPSSVG